MSATMMIILINVNAQSLNYDNYKQNVVKIETQQTNSNSDQCTDMPSSTKPLNCKR